MGKVAAVLLCLALVGCGRSACQECAYALCAKASACDAPAGVRGTDLDECASRANSNFQKTGLTEEECTNAKEVIATLTCAQWKAVASQYYVP